MKKVIFIFFTAFVAVLAFNFMDNNESKIIKALETADTEMLVTFFDEEVQLELWEFDDFANKKMAKTELNKFFIQVPFMGSQESPFGNCIWRCRKFHQVLIIAYSLLKLLICRA